MSCAVLCYEVILCEVRFRVSSLLGWVGWKVRVIWKSCWGGRRECMLDGVCLIVSLMAEEPKGLQGHLLAIY